MPAPTTSLIGQWIAGTGITASGGLVSQWNDQSGLANHFTQGTGSRQPTSTIDTQGNAIVRFPLINSTNGDRFLTTGTISPVMPARACSVWVVARQPNANSNGTYLDVVGYSAAQLRGNAGFLTCGARVSTIVPFSNKTIFASVSGASSVVFHTSVEAITVGTAVTASNSTGALTLAARSAGGFAAMDVYEVLVYNGIQSAGDVADTKAYLIEKYSLPTSYAKQIVYVGDSITAGTNSTDSQSYPFQVVCNTQSSDWMGVNLASSGATITTLNSGVTLRDAAKRTGYRNVLLVTIGRNDVTTLTALEVYSSGANNLVAYVQTAVASGWEVWVGTPIATSNSTFNAKLTELANRIRGTGYAGIISDAGASKVIDFRSLAEFGDSANTSTSYYSGDGTHPSNLGYTSMANLVLPNLESSSVSGRNLLLGVG